ncbi:MAG: alkaline phosphatase D family protein [Pseudomonadota bacterium]|uniref:alkaline phosphatase D family protein n=1 Tax=Sphingomonas sp. ERG5 TaxID=1381597 RepID=UPI00054C3EF8|nr:alkaline phosphatase D family protein [Sphingomonas sp. ERG5]
MEIGRRELVLMGGFGFGAAALAGPAAMAATLRANGFTHNVASGEPGPNSALLWTRYVPAHGGETRLTAEVAETPDFKTIKAGGVAVARRGDDYTARVTVAGLEPARFYYYRFIAANGAVSPIGRTRTLPVGPVGRFCLGVFSCANMPNGWFNAYAHAAARDDIDLMVHTGDYFYEYQRGYYPNAQKAVAGRMIEPPTEAIRLADYRLRLACYRADPDLQRLHQMFPMIAQRDDHELGNDSWAHGAENHTPDEGDYEVRKRASIKAYNEWLPVSGQSWSSYEVGDLATIFRPETRLTARSAWLDMRPAVEAAGDPVANLIALRDGPLADPKRTLMGDTQEQWLYQGMAQSKRRGAKWQVVSQQVLVGQQKLPELPQAMLSNLKLPPEGAAYLKAINAAAKAGLPADLDGWAGFPAARARFLSAAQAADADLIVLSGDSHNAWAFDLAQDGRPAGVEFGGHSVTSPGLEEYISVPPALVGQFFVNASPELKWAETSSRGYMAIELTPEKVTGEWVMMEGVKTRSLATRPSRKMQVERGRRIFSP